MDIYIYPRRQPASAPPHNNAFSRLLHDCAEFAIDAEVIGIHVTAGSKYLVLSTPRLHPSLSEIQDSIAPTNRFVDVYALLGHY